MQRKELDAIGSYILSFFSPALVLTEDTKTTVITEQTTVHLTCKIPNRGKNKVTWTVKTQFMSTQEKIGHTYPSLNQHNIAPQYQERYSFIGNGTLVIKNVKLKDEGSFTCKTDAASYKQKTVVHGE